MISIAIAFGAFICGGVEKALLTMLKKIDYSKYNVTLFLESDEGLILHDFDSHVNIKIWGKGKHFNYNRFLRDLFLQRKYSSCIRSLYFRILSRIFIHDSFRNEKYAKKSCMIDLSNGEKFDFLITYHGFEYYQLLYSVGFIDAKRKICWIHGNLGYYEVNYRKKLMKIYKNYDSFVCVSKSVREHFVSLLPKYEKKSTVIYNLVDIEEINNLANEKIEEKFTGLSFVTVGRVGPEKGQKMIPDIARELLDLGYRFTWFVVGDGPDLKYLMWKVKSLSLDSVVVMTGMKENPYPYMKQCKLYIQPSYTEGFCLATFEARILKKHIVVTDLPVMRELYNKDEAIFCEPTVPSLVAGIQQALSTIDAPVEYKNVAEDFNEIQIKKINEILSF